LEKAWEHHWGQTWKERGNSGIHYVKELPQWKEHKKRKKEAIKNMGDMEKLAFENGYRRGMNDGRREKECGNPNNKIKQH